MEFRPQQFTDLFDFLPWAWARCPGWRGELVVQDVLLQEMRRECSYSLLSDRITHQLHVSFVFMQDVNYRCDPYKLFPEQPTNCWLGWLKKALANQYPFDTSNIGLTHPAKSIRAFCCLIFTSGKPTKPYFLWIIRKDKTLSQRWNII